MDVRALLEDLRRHRDYAGQIVCERFLPPRRAQYADLAPPLPPVLADALRRQGIERLYTHQVEAIQAVRRGEHTVVVTSTASGKTLCYTLPVLETLLADPRARALYLFPTKALAQDQADALAAFDLPQVPAATYDGDTPPARRRRIREESRIILTNPDMLHLGILPQHRRWPALFRHLRYVVIDDMHIYRGVFGSHVALVLRRLRRLCRLYGSSPVCVGTSATIANPREFASQLLGVPVTVVDRDGSPSGPRWVILWNPPLVDRARARRRSAYTEATALFTHLVRAGVRTIAFTKARKITELIYRYAREELRAHDPQLADRIRSYRAGYLPAERRAIERLLFTGQLLGVVSTSALELGIDVGGLDAAILVGYPGTIASTWQRAGRAGRGTGEALVILVALEDALDQYLMRHPDYLFERPVEHAVIDPDNPYILAAHLRCAAAEAPVGPSDGEILGPRMAEVAQVLEEHGDLRRRDTTWVWARPGYPAQEVEVRSASGDAVRIVDARGKVIGTVDTVRACEQVHPGAIYLHQGDTYRIDSLDLERRVATALPADVDYYTQPRTTIDVAIVRPLRRQLLGPTTAVYGMVDVTTQVVAFVRKRLFAEDVLSEEPLDLPPQTLSTAALWWVIPPALAADVRARGLDLAGGIHAVEHAAIGVLPLLAMCDRWDLGGVSYPVYPDLAGPAIFIYEGHPGGVGMTEKGFEMLPQLLRTTLEVIEACPCEAGCPSCIQSPKCGNLNEPLDKAAALRLLRGLLRPGGRAVVAPGAGPQVGRTRRHEPRPPRR